MNRSQTIKALLERGALLDKRRVLGLIIKGDVDISRTWTVGLSLRHCSFAASFVSGRIFDAIERITRIKMMDGQL